MKEELIKLTRSEKPEKNYNKNGYLIKCIGYGMAAQEWLKEKFWQHLDTLDIVLLSYFGNRSYHGSEEDLIKWKTKYFYEDIDKGPLAFILPYLYDDNEVDVFDWGWQKIQSIEIYWCDENGVQYEEKLPKIEDIFDNIDELVSYVKKEIKVLRPPIIDEEGELVQPWEIDEAREVLKQAGWDEQELRYLKWYGCDRAFGACIEVHQKFANYMCKKFDENNPTDKLVLDHILRGLKIANQKCRSLGWNGPQGMCGTYIYRSSEEILNNLDWDIDEDSIVRMPDGRIYTLHEGD